MAPHQTFACKSNKHHAGIYRRIHQLVNAGAPGSSAPFTSSEMPMKNQIEIITFVHCRNSPWKFRILPENNIQYHENHRHHAAQKSGR